MPGTAAVKHLSQLSKVVKRKLSLFWGEALGGSTRINAMVLTRGPPSNYNDWSQEYGLKDWAWERVEPYFIKSENAIGHPKALYRGHRGPVENRQMPLPFSCYPYIEIAARKLGFPIYDDCNNPAAGAQGYFSLDHTISASGRRFSAYQAWLNKDVAIARKSHLTVCTGVTVSKLEIDPESRRAVGVRIHGKGKTSDEDYRVKARREVVLCAGAIGTPPILMRSGIGPEDQLDQLGIPIVQESSAVGNNLMDHISVPIMCKLPARDTIHSLYNPLVFIWQLILWIFFGRGLLAHSSTSSTIFARMTAIDDTTLQVQTSRDGIDTMDPMNPQNVPDVEIMVIPVSCYLDVNVTTHPLMTWQCTLVQPFSKGSLRLATTSPEHFPEVIHPLLRDDRDLVPMRKAIRMSLRLGQEFARSGYPHPAPVLYGPGMDLQYLDSIFGFVTQLPDKEEDKKGEITELPDWQTISDKTIDEYAHRTYQSSLHYACTCRMSLDPADGVVDQRLRVFGVERLRIADASVFPKIPSGHTMAPTMMVAERCADFIKETWRDKESLRI
ncbi:GMC oxidoreductase [Trichoderma citrinoviride]|uniref:GMC oxidoreductase n=1 Tax=Trichoderma citrinoviride TaxID=58853 RepID=A0A2T4BLI9_9HYPO|nr:GMC oxidoreductase [Trichoderma citrinoviride]PTB70177.1 GMC oxidoreductase [Trichoderma citrinoviride]